VAATVRWLLASALLASTTAGAQGAPRRPSANPQTASGARRPPIDMRPSTPRLDVPVTGQLVGPVAVDQEGSAVFGTDDGILSLVTAEGEVRWSLLTGPPHGAPSVDDQGVSYVACGDLHMYAVGHDGKFVWTAPLGGSPKGGVTIGRDFLAVVLDSGVVRFFDRRRGTPLGAVVSGASPAAAPSLAAGGRLLLPSTDGQLVAVDQGGVVWRTRISPAASLGPVAIDAAGAAYVGAADGSVARVGSDGKVVWRTATAGPATRSPVVGEHGRIYLSTGDALVALEPASGAVRWRVPLGAAVGGGPLIADDGTLYVAVQGGAVSGSVSASVVAVSAAGKVTARLALPSGGVVGLTLANHQLWIGTADRTLRRIAVPQRGLAPSSWAKARGGLANAGAAALHAAAPAP